jgi:tuftelin-interacting protein 11
MYAALPVQDTAVILGREQARLQEEVEVARRQVAQAAHVLQEVSRCQATDAHLSLADVARTYSALRSGYREEYLMYNLAAAALSQVRARVMWQMLLLCEPLVSGLQDLNNKRAHCAFSLCCVSHRRQVMPHACWE